MAIDFDVWQYERFCFHNGLTPYLPPPDEDTRDPVSEAEYLTWGAYTAPLTFEYRLEEHAEIPEDPNTTLYTGSIREQVEEWLECEWYQYWEKDIACYIWSNEGEDADTGEPEWVKVGTAFTKAQFETKIRVENP